VRTELKKSSSVCIWVVEKHVLVSVATALFTEHAKIAERAMLLFMNVKIIVEFEVSLKCGIVRRESRYGNTR